LPEVRCPDATSWKYRRPDGVAFILQVRRNKVEPTVLNSSCNLLAKDKLRLTFSDELIPDRPEVPVVLESFLPSCEGE